MIWSKSTDELFFLKILEDMSQHLIWGNVSYNAAYCIFSHTDEKLEYITRPLNSKRYTESVSYVFMIFRNPKINDEPQLPFLPPSAFCHPASLDLPSAALTLKAQWAYQNRKIKQLQHNHQIHIDSYKTLTAHVGELCLTVSYQCSWKVWGG